MRARVATGETTAAQAAVTLKRAGLDLATAPAAVAAAVISFESGGFAVPIARCQRTPEGKVIGSRELSLDEYLTLVDLTGRVLRADKRGAVDVRLPVLLSRLDLQVEAWITTMSGWWQMHDRAIGPGAARDAVAEHQGLRWNRNRCALFAPRIAS